MQANPAKCGSRLCLHTQFQSRFLPGSRNLTVYLPPGYDEDPGHRYPVLTMQDGQNLFENGHAFVSCRTWRLNEALDLGIAARVLEPMIVVGVDHAGERRVAEYTPSVDWKLGGGEAVKYGQMLVEEVLPFIAANYRVKPGATNTGLGGSSLGALAALYLGLRHPNVFGRLAILSPSVWWNHRAILNLVSEAAARMRGPRPRIWLDIGEAEGRRAVADVDLLDRRLRLKGWRAGVDLNYRRFPNAAHDEASWGERAGAVLAYLFPAQAAK